MPNAELNLGDIFLARGDLGLAREMFERVDRFARDPATSAWMRFRYSMRLAASQGELALARGDLDEAAGHARRCLELATRTNARKNLVKAWRLAGATACAARRWDEAGRALHEARTIAEAIGNPTQLWRTYGALAAFHAERARKRRRAGPLSTQSGSWTASWPVCPTTPCERASSGLRSYEKLALERRVFCSRAR